MTAPVWRVLPGATSLRLTDPNSTQVGLHTVAVRREGSGWHWSVVGMMFRLIGSGEAATCDLAQQAAEAALPLRIRRRLAINAESTFR